MVLAGMSGGGYAGEFVLIPDIYLEHGFPARRFAPEVWLRCYVRHWEYPSEEYGSQTITLGLRILP